jgi:hypothetical protein
MLTVSRGITGDMGPGAPLESENQNDDACVHMPLGHRQQYNDARTADYLRALLP